MTIHRTFTELASKHLLWFTRKISQEGLDDNIHRTSFKTFTVVHKKVSPRRFR